MFKTCSLLSAFGVFIIDAFSTWFYTITIVLGAVHNCYRHTLLWEGVNENKIDLVHFQHFNPFFIIFMANCPFEKC